MNRSVTPLLLLLVCSSLAEASPAAAFQAVLERTTASPTRTVTFFQGLAELEDGVVEGQPLADALAAGQVPAGGLLGAFLEGLERVEKRGARVILDRRAEAFVDTGSGLVWLGKRVEIEIREGAATRIRLADLEGAKAGLNRITLLPIRTLELRLDAALLTTATLNVGYALLNKTISLVLARTPETTTSESVRGLSDQLGG